MSKVKKVFGITLCLVLIITALAGCGGTPTEKAGEEAGSAVAEQPEKMVDISYLVWDRGTVPASEGSVEESEPRGCKCEICTDTLGGRRKGASYLNGCRKCT